MTPLAELIIEVLREHGTDYLLDEFECCAQEIADLFEYEYCIMHPDINRIHRGEDGTWSLNDCQAWLNSTNEMWAEKNRGDSGFYIARRPVGKWAPC